MMRPFEAHAGVDPGQIGIYVDDEDLRTGPPAICLASLHNRLKTLPEEHVRTSAVVVITSGVTT
ncbi:hypothetical protein SPRG_16546 [Saprolegnia parasitica CBS 223.65]|uniref:Uncharacterized protein n=1 Tax=Saprolegnia parasitica (strain CBS 223.65) TaxID=695850 RepID=A0A067BIE6_SAPPC|nr:hypothetical protein SPRG_16546 [Saprolegnia parasitica CBS 223.65]KDO17948.1 hypothetical protein SPRG_16546 [Saprolegnia parasitica CBS 223.65]|eukprot:XP_012211344.1 hypothetical protein SPRG_16546 [Saprolegnia parasitica CBS 223.65]